MNIPTKKIALCCVIAAAFTACKKTTTTPTKCLVASETDSASGKTTHYEWTGGKLTKITNDQTHYTSIYSYYSGMIVLEQDTSGVLNYRDTMTINAAGYVIKNSSGGTFEYDGDGHRVKTTYTYTSSGSTTSYVTNYQWSGGNLIKSTEVSSGVTYADAYEYFTDKTNWVPTLFNGKESTNLVKKTTHTGYGTTTTEYQYSFDSKGNPTTVIRLEKDSVGTVSSRSNRTYTYQCN